MKVCGVEFCPKMFSRIHGIWLRYYVWECKTIISREPPRKNEAYLSGKRDFFIFLVTDAFFHDLMKICAFSLLFLVRPKFMLERECRESYLYSIHHI